MKTKRIFIVLVLFLGLIGVKNSLVVSSAHPSNGACTWTPSSPTAGDLLVITYDPATGTIDPAVASLNMHWQMSVEGNKFVTIPSQSMWPAGTSVDTWNGPTTAITPMTNKSDGTWEVSFTLSYVAEELIVWFVGGGVTDKPSGGWKIESQLKAARIFPISPAFNNPKFAIPGGSSEFVVNASDSASNWDVVAIGKSDTPISLSPTATFDSTNDNWVISVTIPSTMPLGLYDLQYQSTIGGTARTHIEHNSLSVTSKIKSDYWIIVISDQQHFRDGSYGANKNAPAGDASRVGNFTDVLKVLNLLDPEFILVLGDMTEWCDEVAMENQKRWIVEYLDVPMFSLPGNHDEFERTGSTGNHEYGSGRGVWQRVFGPSHWTLMYGTHYYAPGFSDDQQILSIPGESDWIQDVITNAPAGATMKTYMQHHPIDESYYGTDENVDIADDIKSWLKTGKFDYFLHGHMHSDRYSVLEGTTHIGTDNCVGSESAGFSTGIRLIHVQNNEFTQFSYGPVVPSTPGPTGETSHSNPLFDASDGQMVYVEFSQANDGSLTSNTATFHYGYNHSYQGARVRFAMKTTSKCYNATGGTIKSEFLYNNVYYVDVEFNVDADSTTTITVTETDCPTETPTSTTSEPTTTTGGGASGFGAILVISTVGTVVVIRRRKKI